MSNPYYSGALRVVSEEPSHFAHAERGVFAPGINGGRNGVTFDPPSGSVGEGGPQFNGHYVRGPTHADYYDGNVQTVNGRGTYHMAQNVTDWKPCDTQPGVPTFAVRLPPGEADVDMRLRSYKMYGISIFNQQMKHNPAWRKKYGSQTDCAAILRDFAYLGVQQSKQTLLKEYGTFNEENNFVVDGRCRMPNLFLAQAPGAGTKGKISELNVGYFLLRRHRYDGDKAARAETWNKKKRNVEVEEDGGSRRKKIGGTGASAAAPMVVDKVELKTQIQSAASQLFPRGERSKKPQDGKLAIVGEEEDIGEPSCDYYWSWDPWVSYLREPPPVALYNGNPQGDPHNQYIGDFIPVGMCIHVMRGTNERTSGQVEKAQRALYPDVRDDDYLVDLRTLDEIELSLRDGQFQGFL